MCKQITLLLPNRAGEFFNAAKLLGSNDINIIGFHLTSEGSFGLLQLLCDRHNDAFTALHSHYRFYCTERDVLIVELTNKPNELQRVLYLLYERDINLPNSYQINGIESKTYIVLEFGDEKELEASRTLFIEAGFMLIKKVKDIEYQ